MKFKLLIQITDTSTLLMFREFSTRTSLSGVFWQYSCKTEHLHFANTTTANLQGIMLYFTVNLC